MSLAPGTRLGPYEIVELRGKGGMGEVYRARDTRLARDVAVKVLPADLSDDGSFKRRFEREAKVISQLQHPNVCTLHDVGTADGVDFLVMELLEGETLQDRIAGGPLPLPEVARIGREIAAAVHAAHERGLVHRDLKPGNVMLAANGAKVLDFGLAKETLAADLDPDAETRTLGQSLTARGQLVGTVPYMAPEQIEGRAADRRTDVWALGCILFEMATGTRPFRASSQAGLIGAILKDPPSAPDGVEPPYPPRLGELLARCLEKDPDRRWQSARDLSLALESIAGSGEEPEHLVAPEARPSGWRWAIAAAVVLAAAASLALLTVLRRGEATTPPNPTAADVFVAVMPFENQSGDTLGDRLALGIPTEVTARFAEIWPVASRAAAFAHRDRSACEAAREIPANAIMQGAVLVTPGASVRVTAEVIGCPQGEPVWTETFDAEGQDQLALQDSVAARIVSASRGALWQQTLNTPE
ncbi:MAG: serine/threonine-protein kinase, partial [Thermoanaerobaculia bacterium]|nr:serine/threonine-protein kinase [Thermoanaerobaculia bacterium]